ncbi:unnamed protein product [Spodoptera exigua]|nr:unnamed protein product [Spodoptera exigua]
MSDSDVHYSRIPVPNTTAFKPPLVSVVVEYLVLVMTLAAFVYGAISWCLIKKFRHFRNFVYINAIVSSLLRLLTVSIIIPCVMQVIVIDDKDILDICRYICTYFSAVQNYWMLVICYIFYVDIVKDCADRSPDDKRGPRCHRVKLKTANDDDDVDVDDDDDDDDYDDDDDRSITQTMALSTYLLLITLHVTLAQDCVINNLPERTAFEKQLRKDLKCDYKIFDPPPQNGSSFPVNIKFVMKKFSFNSEEDTFSVQARMFVSWNDPRLRWNPEKYYGIDVTEMSVMNIWAPTIALVNTVSAEDFENKFYIARCKIFSDGDVQCVRRVTHDAFCNVNLAHWPYDQQECHLIFEASDSKWLKTQINATSRIFSMLGAEYGAEWMITDYKQEANHSSSKQVKLTFVVDREATGLAAIVVYPAMILSFLSMNVLFMDVRRPIRLGLASFCLLCHHYFLCELAENIPKKNIQPPNLLLYYRASVVLSLLIMLLTCRRGGYRRSIRRNPPTGIGPPDGLAGPVTHCGHPDSRTPIRGARGKRRRRLEACCWSDDKTPRVKPGKYQCHSIQVI